MGEGWGEGERRFVLSPSKDPVIPDLIRNPTWGRSERIPAFAGKTVVRVAPHAS